MDRPRMIDVDAALDAERDRRAGILGPRETRARIEALERRLPAEAAAVSVAVPIVAALPTATVLYDGQLRVLRVGGGVADTVWCCAKNAAGAYAWLPLG